jgi:alpha-galactosidase
MGRVEFKFKDHRPVVFAADDKNVLTESLFGLLCGDNGRESALRQAAGMFHIRGGGKRHEGASFRLRSGDFQKAGAVFTWDSQDGLFTVRSVWDFSLENGVLSRRDSIENSSGEKLSVSRCFSRFVLSHGSYEVYAQDSLWGRENQGEWIPLHAGGLLLGTKWGRTSEGGTPYMALREKDGGAALAFHIVPRGNWRARILRVADSNRLPLAVVELGLPDEDLDLSLAPGETFEMPEIIVQGLTDGKPESGAFYLHRYLGGRFGGGDAGRAPVVYNTWFDCFGKLEPERLRSQLAAAKELGCEVFVIDAGWYGGEGLNWSQAVGDWRERQDSAFRGKMSVFADEVREAGLGFGFWIEPERFSGHAPVVSAHPEWFTETVPGNFRIDLSQKAARDYQFGEISRLIDTYKPAYIKMDMNAELGYDASGGELYYYALEWFSMVSALRKKYPGVVIENCSSGAMRTDIAAMSVFDTCFPSDNVNPADTVGICQGLMLRTRPGQIMRWVALRESPGAVSDLSGNAAAALVTPKSATWNCYESASPDFVMLSALPGMLGFTSDIAGLSERTKAVLRRYVDFYKSKRNFFLNSACHLLTGIKRLGDRDGWTALQLQSPDARENMVFVYHRNDDGQTLRRIALRGLDLAAAYRVTRPVNFEGAPVETLTGAALMTEGLAAQISYDMHGAPKALLFSVEKI